MEVLGQSQPKIPGISLVELVNVAFWMRRRYLGFRQPRIHCPSDRDAPEAIAVPSLI